MGSVPREMVQVTPRTALRDRPTRLQFTPSGLVPSSSIIRINGAPLPTSRLLVKPSLSAASPRRQSYDQLDGPSQPAYLHRGYSLGGGGLSSTLPRRLPQYPPATGSGSPSESITTTHHQHPSSSEGHNRPLRLELSVRNGDRTVSSSSETNNNSILKKTETALVGTGYSTTGRPAKRTTFSKTGSCGSHRRVGFKNNVAVYRFDSDGDSACSSSECERLNVEPRDRKTFLERNLRTAPGAVRNGASGNKLYLDDVDGRWSSRMMSLPRVPHHVTKPPERPPSRKSTSSPPLILQIRGVQSVIPPPSSVTQANSFTQPNINRAGSMPTLKWQELPKRGLTPTLTTPPSPPSQLGSVSYALIDDPTSPRGRKLIMTIGLNYNMEPDDVLVKASKTGNKIRIVSVNNNSMTNNSGQGMYSSVTSSHTTGSQLNESIVLPVEVDPFRVVARLDVNGSLVVEAPVVQH